MGRQKQHASRIRQLVFVTWRDPTDRLIGRDWMAQNWALPSFASSGEIPGMPPPAGTANVPGNCQEPYLQLMAVLRGESLLARSSGVWSNRPGINTQKRWTKNVPKAQHLIHGPRPTRRRVFFASGSRARHAGCGMLARSTIFRGSI